MNQAVSAAGSVGVGRDGMAIGAAAGSAGQRLEDQLAWYDAKAKHHKDWFQRLKVVQIAMAAVIPVAAGAGARAWVVQATVERIVQRLKRAALEPWLGRWSLTPRGEWQRELNAGLDASAACAVFVGPDDLGAWELQEVPSRSVAS